MASIGRYELLDVLGQGATGRVYRARSFQEGMPFAVKLLRSDLAEDQSVITRFIHERSLLTTCEHPNLIHIVDLVVENGFAAIVMELANGGDLRSKIVRDGGIDDISAVVVTVGVLEALDYIHERGIVHRDIKPENVLLMSSGQAKLADFGIAKIMSESSTGYHATAIVGTPNYLAPEVAEGDTATSAGDIYATGILLYELLSGATPFEGGHPMAVLMRHTESTARPIPGVSPALHDAMMSMLAKDPASRPSARAASGALRQILQDETSPAEAVELLAAAGVAVPMEGQRTRVVGRQEASAERLSQTVKTTSGSPTVISGAVGRSTLATSSSEISSSSSQVSGDNRTIVSSRRVSDPSAPGVNAVPRRRRRIVLAAGVVFVVLASSAAAVILGGSPSTKTTAKLIGHVTEVSPPVSVTQTSPPVTTVTRHTTTPTSPPVTTVTRHIISKPKPKKGGGKPGTTSATNRSQVLGPYSMDPCQMYVQPVCVPDSVTRASAPLVNPQIFPKTSNLFFDCSRYVPTVGLLDHVVGSGPWIIDKYVQGSPGSKLASCPASII